MKFHAIMITQPYQGHLSPFVSLALKLAYKGFKVTFVHTEYSHHCITKSAAVVNDDDRRGTTTTADLFAEARRNAGAGVLDIHYRTISDGFPLEFDRVANLVEFWESLVNDFPDIVAEFVGKLLSSDDSSSYVPILVADAYPGWAAKVAQKYGLVNVSFWTEPALVFAATYYKNLLEENGHFPPPKDGSNHTVDYIPGIESISTKDLPTYFRESSQVPALAQKIAFHAFEQIKKAADFILLNTVRELEPNVLSSLNRTHPSYSIGPINFCKESTRSLVPKSLFSETDCSKWLDDKPSKSVLYISFGSIVVADKKLMEEISNGLALSGVSFLWVIRDHRTSGNNDGEDSGKGLIVPWCDQRAVLSHRAIGGFLTHCGWNSVLESMWFGVPMICCPNGFDQPTNKKLVVDDWKVGIDLPGDEGIVNGETVAEKIKKVMSDDDGYGEAIRNEMVKVRKVLHRALEDDDGSSEVNFSRFVDDLKSKILGQGVVDQSS